MNINISRMSRVGTLSLLTVAGALSFAQFANASTIDTTNHVTYELSSTFTPVSDNTYNVFLAIDTSAFSQGPGFLTALALQFNNPTSVTLLNAPGGVGDWSVDQPGGLNANGCNGSGNFDCFAFTGSDNATAVPSASLFVFRFAVTLPTGTALSASNDIKAEYNAAKDGSGHNLGITSQAATIDSCIGGGCGTINPLGTNPTPEPGTIVMMISGLGLLGIGTFRKVRS
jgi:hypothetical protein